MRNILTRQNFPLILSVIAFIFVFLLNLKINLVKTALIRGGFSFIIFYAIGTIITLIYTSDKSPDDKDSEEIKGKNVKMDTPEDDLRQLFNEMYHSNENADNKTDKENDPEFKPMQFKKLDLDEEENIEDIVKGIREWSKDN